VFRIALDGCRQPQYVILVEPAFRNHARQCWFAPGDGSRFIQRDHLQSLGSLERIA